MTRLTCVNPASGLPSLPPSPISRPRPAPRRTSWQPCPARPDPAARAWVREQTAKILAGKHRDVRAGIRRRATAFGYSPAERAGADECARYLENKQDYLDYPAFLAAGWPVASGLIEGAARWLIKDRRSHRSQMEPRRRRSRPQAPRPRRQRRLSRCRRYADGAGGTRGRPWAARAPRSG